MPRLTRRTTVRAAVTAAVAAVPLVAGGWMLQARVASNAAGSPQLLGQVMDLVSQRFVDTVGAGALYERAARGLVKELNDPYSELFTPKQIADFSRTTNGRYAGIGMEILPPGASGGYVTVARVFPGSPAEAGGVQEGDRIAQIDTASARGWNTQQVQTGLLGPPGTRVRVTFQRPGVPQPITANFTRAVIRIPAVPYSLSFDGTVGYVPVQRFSENTAEEIGRSIRALEARGAKGVILDLRSNPGGILEQAVSTSNLFLRRGQEVLSQRGRQGEQQVYVATEQPVAPSIPLVVMIDGGSASASEIVAGALQDHDRALVVGTTSFGKGLVQTVFPLDGGYALKLTTAKYYLPSGRSIHKERKLQADGTFAEEKPDSLESDSARKARPVFRSDAGRVVYGGGAVTPDVVVKPDTFTTAAQNLAKALAPKFPEIAGILSDYAFEQKGKVRPDFAVTPAMREEFLQRLTRAGVKVDRAVWDAGGQWIDEQLDARIARVAFGDSTVRRRDARTDPQLQRAIALVKRAGSQRELFAVAQAAVPTSTANRQTAPAPGDSARQMRRGEVPALVPQSSVPPRR